MMKKEFNADLRMAEQTNRPIIINGKKLFPVRRTGAIAKAIAKLGAPPDLPEGSPESVAASMDYLYKSLSILIVDEDGNHPDPEELEDTLAWDIAQELMAFINPEMEEALGNAGGSQTSSPQTQPSPVTTN
jgi:hypothetical protein